MTTECKVCTECEENAGQAAWGQNYQYRLCSHDQAIGAETCSSADFLPSLWVWVPISLSPSPITICTIYSVCTMYVHLYNLPFGCLWLLWFLESVSLMSCAKLWKFSVIISSNILSPHSFFSLLLGLWWHKCIFCDCPTSPWGSVHFFFSNVRSLCCSDGIIPTDLSSGSLIFILLSSFLY